MHRSSSDLLHSNSFLTATHFPFSKKRRKKCFTIWIKWKTTNYSFSHLGDSWKWICSQSPTATKTEAHDTTTSASCNAYPVAMALLCSRRALFVRGDMENSSSSITESTSVVSFTSRSIASHRWSYEHFLCFCSSPSCIFDITTSMATTTTWKSKAKLRRAISDVSSHPRRHRNFFSPSLPTYVQFLCMKIIATSFYFLSYANIDWMLSWPRAYYLNGKEIFLLSIYPFDSSRE